MKLRHLTFAFATLTGAAVAQEPIWDANTVELESQQLAAGVYAVVQKGAEEMAAQGVPLATSAGFVIGEDGVLLIDTMLNARLAEQLFALVAAQTDKPIRYAVNTSFHGDHSYGNAYLPDDVIIIQHAATADYIDAHFAQDTAFMIANFGEGRGIEQITPTEADLLVGAGGALTVDLGGVTAEIRDYGFAQTGGDLFVRVPQANALWTGNAIVAEAPALPWLLDGHLVETRDTLQRVHDATDDATHIVPGHGPVTDRASLAYAIDYLTAVETQVAAAIAEGLSLEETVARVDASGFEGYALFGWVHPALNVPAAYHDLQ